MLTSGNAFQVAVAWQAKIETGGNLLPLDENQGQLALRLPCDERVPEKNLVHRAVVQEFARHRWQARSHDADLSLMARLPDGSSNSRHIHHGAAFEALEVRMFGQQLLRFLIGGVE